MSRYILTIPAKEDIKDIIAYIARYNSGSARKFKDKIKQQCKLLASFPIMGQSCDNFEVGLRSFPLDNYLIFYRSISNGVEIVRVLSGYRDLETLFSVDGD